MLIYKYDITLNVIFNLTFFMTLVTFEMYFIFWIRMIMMMMIIIIIIIIITIIIKLFLRAQFHSNLLLCFTKRWFYGKIHYLTREFHVKLHAKTDIARIAKRWVRYRFSSAI